MARWSSGDPWEPSGDEASPSLWSATDAGVGWPDVFMGGVNVCDRVARISWRSGRSSWLSDPEPGSASIELRGAYDPGDAYLAIGSPLVIGARPGRDLWRGTVDTIAETWTPDGRAVQVTAVDDLSRVLSTELYGAGVALAAGDLADRILDLAGLAGVAPRDVRRAPSDPDVALPTLAAVTLTGALGPHLSACERASNAIVAQDPDGTWVICQRTALPVTPHVVDLVGDSCPSEVQRSLASPERVRNAFTIAGVETLRQASIAKYGRRSYDVPANVATTAPPYSPEFMDAVSEPVPAAAARVRIETRQAELLGIPLLGFARLPADPPATYYQLLAADWTAAPNSWEARLGLDRTQSSIAPPPVVVPPDPPPPVTTARVTDTFACDRDAYVVKSGSLELGNGVSEYLLAGLLADGQLCRVFLRFALAWRGKVVTVHSATLKLTTTTWDCMSPSSPSVDIYRVTSSWSEGSGGGKCSFVGSNSVVYPGPSVTSTGKVTRTLSKSDNVTSSATITAIAAAWAAGSSNYGVSLRGSSESSATNRAEVWGRGATSSRRPVLVVDYTYQL